MYIFACTFQNKNYSYKIHYVPLSDNKKFKKYKNH